MDVVILLNQVLVLTLMKFLEYKSNAWGQQILEGVSWNLIWFFVAAGLVVIVIHVAYVARRQKLERQPSGGESSAEQFDE